MEKETLQKVSDTTTDKPVTIEVDIYPQTRVQAFLQRWGVLPKKRVFLLKPIFLGTMLRISKLLLTLDMKLPEKDGTPGFNHLEANYEAISQHAGTMAKIVALAIQNTEKEPDGKLERFVMNNFTSKEMMSVLIAVLNQMDLKNFMISIISVRGLNVLETRKAASVMDVSAAEVSL